MLRYVLPPFAALAICAFGVTAEAGSGGSPGPAGMERMQHWASDHEALLDAKLGGLKAGLKLTPDQEKLWPPFEAAVRDAAKTPMEQMKAMMDRMQRMRGMNMTEQMQDTNDMKDMGPPGQSVSPVAFCAVAQTACAFAGDAERRGRLGLRVYEVHLTGPLMSRVLPTSSWNTGLSEAEAQARLKAEGYNELPRPDRRTTLRIVFD